MRGRKLSFSVVLSDKERAELERWQRSTSMPAGLATRARAILLLADGVPRKDVVVLCNLAPRIVRKWARRFIAERIAGLYAGRDEDVNRPFPPQVGVQIVKLACELPSLRGVPIGQWDCTELALKMPRPCTRTGAASVKRDPSLVSSVPPWRWNSPAAMA